MRKLLCLSFLFFLSSTLALGEEDPVSLQNGAASEEKPKEDLTSKDETEKDLNSEFLEKMVDLKTKNAANLLASMKFFSQQIGAENYLVSLNSAYSVYLSLSNPKRHWDINSLSDTSLNFVEMGSYITGVGIPYAIAMRGMHTVYTLGPVNQKVHSHLFGDYLYGPKTRYDVSDFSSEKMNNPYLVCNYYGSLEDMYSGFKPTHSIFVNRTDYGKLGLSSYYKNYAIMHGRWIKVMGPKFSVIRFASIDDPFQTYNACVHTLIQHKIIPASPNEEELSKISPQVAYTQWNLNFPVYYYTKISFKEGKKNKDKMVLVSSVDKETSKHSFTSNDENAKGGSLGDLYKSLLKNNKPETIFPIMDQMIFLAGEYYDLHETYEHGNALSTDLLLRLSQSTVGAFYKMGAYFPGASRIATLLSMFGSGYYFVKMVGVQLSQQENFDEFIYGRYLQGPKDNYDIEEFEPSKLNQSYLICNFYENKHDIVNKGPAYWTLAKASALPENNKDKVYGKNVVLHGRWMQMEKKSLSFASLDDPFVLLTTCSQTLNLEQNSVSKSYKLSDLSKNIVMTTGNIILPVERLRFTHYPIQFYFKRKVEIQDWENKTTKDMVTIYELPL